MVESVAVGRPGEPVAFVIASLFPEDDLRAHLDLHPDLVALPVTGPVPQDATISDDGLSILPPLISLVRPESQ